MNYEIYDKEILDIVDSFQEWRHLLEIVSHFVTLYKDHKNVKYFITIHILNSWQACWNMTLSRFNFTIIYHPGKQ